MANPTKNIYTIGYPITDPPPSYSAPCYRVYLPL